MHINPDHFLETPLGRIFTPERNQTAWEKCFNVLKHEILFNPKIQKIYVLIGAQAAGKSSWAENKIKNEPNNIVFDAILVQKMERASIIKIANQHNIECIAVMFRTPLSVCLERNSKRTPDTKVDEQAIKNVFAALEAPSLDEGFRNIILV